MKEQAVLSDAPGRDEVIGDSDNESPQNENAEERDMCDARMQMWTSNYIIVREIMSHLDWREQVRCELVCRLWRDAVKSVQRTSSLRSYDFTMVRDTFRSAAMCFEFKLHISDLPVQTRPMCAIGFYVSFLECKILCQNYSPPCDLPCATEHTMIEAVCENMVLKRSCLLAAMVAGESSLIYMPLPTSRTYRFRYTPHNMGQFTGPCIMGHYLPKMDNVNYHTVQYRSERTAQENFHSAIDNICATDIIKGVVLFIQNEFLIIESGYFGFLNYIKNKQPSIPYALGGCGMSREDYQDKDITEEEVIVTLGVFSVPKVPELVPGPPCKFNMHSLVIDRTMRDKATKQKVIQAFAGNISEHKYSAALILSSYESQWSQPVEQLLFRASFPRTVLLGCYSYIVIGSNHTDICPQPTEGTERQSGPKFMQCDSAVFVYFSWG